MSVLTEIEYNPPYLRGAKKGQKFCLIMCKSVKNCFSQRLQPLIWWDFVVKCVGWYPTPDVVCSFSMYLSESSLKGADEYWSSESSLNGPEMNSADIQS